MGFNEIVIKKVDIYSPVPLKFLRTSYMFKPFSVIMYKNIIDDTEIISLGVTKSSGGVKECKWASFKIHEKIMHSLKVKYL